MTTAETIIARKGPDVTTIEQDATVLEAATRMNQQHIGALVVTEGERAVGIFSERDVLNRVVAAEKDPANVRVGDVMTSPMACCKRSTTLEECKTVMSSKRIRHLPVVEDGQMFGMISTGDILAVEVADQQATIEYLNEYLFGHR